MCCEQTKFILRNRTKHFGKLRLIIILVNVVYKADHVVVWYTKAHATGLGSLARI
jgi:hypothetical protein